MSYLVNGEELETDEQGYRRDRYREHGHTPNFRIMLKDMGARLPGCDSKMLYDLCPLGKGGY